MNRPHQKYSLLLPLIAVVLLVAPQVAFANAIEGTLYFLVVNLFGMLVYIGGAILDFAINNFVLGFGGTFANSGIGVAVNNGWAVIRDFINLFFIFGLVYIGFRMILDSDNSNVRRWLANLIMAALLINFSLFITKFVVDFSNQLSAEIAVAGLGAKPSTTDPTKFESDVSGQMMNHLGLTSAFQTTTLPPNASYGYIFGLAILFMITAFVFGAGGILLIIRFAVLNLYLVFSAVMFVGWVLPPVGDQMSKYWNSFLKRCFFAPIFLLFLYFAFQMVGELQKTVVGGLALGNAMMQGDSANVQDATLGTMPFFFLVCVFMIIALLAAQKVGADGANMAVSMGKRWGTKTAKFANDQTTKRAARAAGGVAARGVNDASAGLRRRYNSLAVRAQNSTSARGRVANRLLRGTDGLTQGALSAGEGASVLGSETRAQQTARRDAFRNRNNENQRAANRATAAASTPPPINEHSTPEEIAAHQDALRARQRQTAAMSPQELLEFIRRNNAEMVGVRAVAGEGGREVADVARERGVVDASSPEFLAMLTDAQMTAYEASGMLTTPEIAESRAARDEGAFADITEILNNSNATTPQITAALERFSQSVQAFSPERLSAALTRQLASGEPVDPTFAANMTQAQFTGWRNTTTATTAEIAAVNNARMAGLGALATNGNLVGGWTPDPAGPTAANPSGQTFTPTANANAASVNVRPNLFRNVQQAGSLPAAALANPNVSQYLTPQIAEAFLSNSPTLTDIDLVRTAIERHVNGGGAGTARAAWTTWNNTVNGAQIGTLSFNQPAPAGPGALAPNPGPQNPQPTSTPGQQWQQNQQARQARAAANINQRQGRP